MSERLGRMFMMLVERYSVRLNWRGYCVDQETQALTKRGWLYGNEITTDDEILSRDSGDGALKWSSIKSIYRDEFSGNMFKLDAVGLDAMVTPGHKWVTPKGNKPVDFLLEKDKLILMGSEIISSSSLYEDAFVELVGWVCTEGTIWNCSDRSYSRVGIYQNEGPYADRIRSCISLLGEKYSETTKGNNIRFLISKSLGERIVSVLGEGKSPLMSFLNDISTTQRKILLETMLDGDGWRTVQKNSVKRGYSQKNEEHVNCFVALCTMLGIRTSIKKRNQLGYGKIREINIVTLFTSRRNNSNVENIDFHGGKSSRGVIGQGKHQNSNLPTVAYSGQVWCPETEYGCFIARRNGTIYLTGNSYRDEMCGLALTHLSQVGLQFDESKSINPFGFYTTTIQHCLGGDTEILTREYGSVPIRDVADQDVTLLDGNQEWVKCHIYDHGIQETQLNYFMSGGRTEEIWSTLDHGWVTPSGEKIKTREFAGHNVRIADLRPKREIEDEAAYREGVQHGIMYGDGNREGENFSIRLCGEKVELLNFLTNTRITYPPSSNGELHVRFSSAVNLKKLPNTVNLDYLRGFLRGWFATDGCVGEKSGTPTLCGDEAEYDWIKKWGPLVGWHVNGFTKLDQMTNYGRRNKVSLNFHLRKSSLELDDFLRSKHKTRWGNKPSRSRGKDIGNKYDWVLIESMLAEGKSSQEVADILGLKVTALRSSYSQLKKARLEKDDKYWAVTNVKQPNEERRLERVYCPVVPTTQTFALTSGIKTANCFTRILNLEKKSQAIRDELLINMGMSPSHTRQIANEMAQSGHVPPAKMPVKRGRKTAVQVEAEKKAAKEQDENQH